jgi:tetratricopeptide (TPR) repeat protein
MDGKRADLSDLDRFLEKTAGAEQTRTDDGEASAGRVGLTGASSPDEERAPSVPFTEVEERERRELRELCDTMRDQDHYSVLGVERSANQAAIRDAYYRLARAHHPDRYLRPHLLSMHRDLEHMFAAITDAYGVLSNNKEREEYDREMNAWMAGRSDQGMGKQASARDLYLRGRKAMDAKKVFAAIGLFEQATKLDPSRGEYFYHLGTCQAHNPRWKKKAEENLLKSLDLNPGNAECYLALARLYRRGGLERRSQEMYREALRWDPSSAEAKEALKKEEGDTAGGLLGSLFKKA